MSIASDTARVAAAQLAANPDQKTIEIDTPNMSSQEILAIIDAIYTECEAAGVKVKGVKVDPLQLGLPGNPEFLNGFLSHSHLIIVDLDVDEKVIVRRK